MTKIKVLDNLVDVKDEDVRELEAYLESNIRISSKLIEIYHPKNLPSQNVSAGNLYVCRFDDDCTVGMKLCMNNHMYIQRELFVAKMRDFFKMNNYKLSYKNGLSFRDANSCQTLPALARYVTSELVFIDFGKMNHRKNFLEFQRQDIKNLSDFYLQYGMWCAFDYIVGATDRNAKNYVHDLDTGQVYSVDNEARPVQPDNNEFKHPDSEVGGFSTVGKMFLPAEKKEGNECKNAFAKGFTTKWSDIVDLAENLTSTADPANSRDIEYIRAIVTDHDSKSVLGRISL